MHSQQPTDIRTDPDQRAPGPAAAPYAPARDPESSYQTAVGANAAPRQDTLVIPRESKPGIKTSEFWIMLAMVGATLAATYADQDSLARVDGWRFAALVVAAYIVSRGLAKIGTADRKVHERS
jgi:hypothetical protein